jgi:hypothetical protein
VRTKNAAHGQNRLKSADFEKRNNIFLDGALVGGKYLDWDNPDIDFADFFESADELRDRSIPFIEVFIFSSSLDTFD